MNTKELATASYLDIIFEGRNKAYGAFELRKHYPQRTRHALAAVLSALMLVCAYPLLASKENSGGKSYVLNHEVPIPHIMAEMPKPKTPEGLHPQRPVVLPAPTVAITVPVIVENNEALKPPARMDTISDRQPGPANSAGTAGGSLALANTSTGNNVDGHDLIPGPQHNEHPDKGIVVDQQPVFNGDLGDWLSEHIQFPEEARSVNVEGEVRIEFVVDEDGRISDVVPLTHVGHGFEEEAMRVAKIMPRWRPGRYQGQPVRTHFTLPVQFTLE